jgi:hypothetical protein
LSPADGRRRDSEVQYSNKTVNLFQRRRKGGFDKQLQNLYKARVEFIQHVFGDAARHQRVSIFGGVAGLVHVPVSGGDSKTEDSGIGVQYI